MLDIVAVFWTKPFSNGDCLSCLLSITNNQTVFTRMLYKTSPFTIKSMWFSVSLSSNGTLRSMYLFCDKCTQTYSFSEESHPASSPKSPKFDHSFSLHNVALFIHFLHITYFLHLQVNEATVEQLVQQYPHITFSTVLQDCKRTLERAYQMGWTPSMSTAS